MTSFPELKDRLSCKNMVVTRSGLLKWFHDRERHISLKGCWRLFSTEHLQGPLSLTILLKNAVYSNTTESDMKIRSFCMDPTEVEKNIHPTIRRNLELIEEFEIRTEVILDEYAYVLMDVSNYSLLTWIYRKRTINGRQGWELLVIWRVSIYKMWKILKKYWQSGL